MREGGQSSFHSLSGEATEHCPDPLPQGLVMTQVRTPWCSRAARGVRLVSPPYAARYGTALPRSHPANTACQAAPNNAVHNWQPDSALALTWQEIRSASRKGDFRRGSLPPRAGSGYPSPFLRPAHFLQDSLSFLFFPPTLTPSKALMPQTLPRLRLSCPLHPRRSIPLGAAHSAPIGHSR